MSGRDNNPCMNHANDNTTKDDASEPFLTTLLRLPAEVVPLIMEFVHPTDRTTKLPLVCKAWHQQVETDYRSLWKDFQSDLHTRVLPNMRYAGNLTQKQRQAEYYKLVLARLGHKSPAQALEPYLQNDDTAPTIDNWNQVLHHNLGLPYRALFPAAPWISHEEHRMALSPRGSQIAVSLHSGIYVYDTTTKRLVQTIRLRNCVFTAALFFPNEDLVVHCDNRHVRAYSVANAQLQYEYKFPEETHGNFSYAHSRSILYILSDHEETLYVFDTVSNYNTTTRTILPLLIRPHLTNDSDYSLYLCGGDDENAESPNPRWLLVKNLRQLDVLDIANDFTSVHRYRFNHYDLVPTRSSHNNSFYGIVRNRVFEYEVNKATGALSGQERFASPFPNTSSWMRYDPKAAAPGFVVLQNTHLEDHHLDGHTTICDSSVSVFDVSASQQVQTVCLGAGTPQQVEMLTWNGSKLPKQIFVQMIASIRGSLDVIFASPLLAN